ncbi:hypothetical protein [Pseudogulbenkiania subflava]|nr:hypothetical protein [Pseudogulbenkiania subflava]
MPKSLSRALLRLFPDPVFPLTTLSEARFLKRLPADGFAREVAA